MPSASALVPGSHGGDGYPAAALPRGTSLRATMGGELRSACRGWDGVQVLGCA